MANPKLMSELKELLERSDINSAEERDEAISLIQKMYALKKCQVIEGGCFSCGEHIQYANKSGSFNSGHWMYGTEWLEIVKKKWVMPERIWGKSLNGSSFTINGYCYDRIKQYLCQPCQKRTTIIGQAIASGDFFGCALKVLEDTYKLGWSVHQWKGGLELMKSTPTAPSALARSEYHLKILVPLLALDHYRKVPYKDFLKSHYWRTLKEIVVRDRGKICEQCGSKEHIHLHHESYKNLGNEINHLEDLKLLCNVCHAEHHDRVPEVPKWRGESEL